ncbi:MAG: hypothetical protein PUC97_07600 [bacterium]|nr:hypothetical protein [bacterium]
MRALLAAALLCVCVLIGNSKAGALRKRKRTLSAMEEDIRRLAEQMELQPLPLGTLLARFQPHTEALWEIFRAKLSGEAPVAELWQEALAEAAQARNGFELLSEEETAILVDFGMGLGGGGIAAQNANAALACKRLSGRITALETELAKKGKLFESLGMLLGLALALLVI